MGVGGGEEQTGRETLVGSSGQALEGQYKKRQEETDNLLCGAPGLLPPPNEGHSHAGEGSGFQVL